MVVYLIQPLQDPSEVHDLAQWEALSNVHELNNFMGNIYLYRKLVSHFSQMAHPLHELSNHTKLTRMYMLSINFQRSRQEYLFSLILHLMDMNHPFEIEKNAS
jgi:hypothetical protein